MRLCSFQKAVRLLNKNITIHMWSCWKIARVLLLSKSAQLALARGRGGMEVPMLVGFQCGGAWHGMAWHAMVWSWLGSTLFVSLGRPSPIGFTRKNKYSLGGEGGKRADLPNEWLTNSFGEGCLKKMCVLCFPPPGFTKEGGLPPEIVFFPPEMDFWRQEMHLL